MLSRNTSATLVTLALATAIHLDWHAARPADHHLSHLSFGLPAHWLLAIPVFGLVAWYVARNWPTNAASASLVIISVAIVLAGLVEPVVEYYVLGASAEWAFGRPRFVALAAFLGMGLVTYAASLAFFRRRPA